MESNQPNYSTSKSREEVYDEDNTTNLLPRAVLRPNGYILLDGEWNFSIDINDTGLEEQWYLKHYYSEKAHWPGSVEQHIASAKHESFPAEWNDKIVAWYERHFLLPEMSTEINSSNKILQLTFGACGYETQVWLNGIPLTTIEGALVHVGEYTSFSYELPSENLQADNRLTVRIADTMDADITRGKQESHVYKRGGIWYQTYTGAVRSIWLEQVERNRLRTQVGFVSIVEDRLVRVNVTSRISDAGVYTIRLNVLERKHKEGEKPLATSDFVLQLDKGQKRQRLVIEVPGSELWSPEHPNLYRLVAQLIDSNGYVAEIETTFGLRKIEARGSKIYLNNEPVYLDGILYQPGIATYEQIRKHMYAMKELGCNLVRIHIAGVDPRIYNLADKIGLLLWVEVPSPHQSSVKSRMNHKEELLRMLALIGTHPSVVIWSLYNEDWGVQDIATNVETRKYIIDTYHYMQLANPQFLVVDNDGWQHISFEGRLKSDLLTAHLYTSDFERWKELLDKLVNGELTGVAPLPLVVGDPFFFHKQIPLIVSEWGGFGWIGYGGPKNNDERAPKIKSYKEELRKHAIAGDVYTQATNIEEEVNGLIDAETGELKVPAGLLSSQKPDNINK